MTATRYSVTHILERHTIAGPDSSYIFGVYCQLTRTCGRGRTYAGMILNHVPLPLGYTSKDPLEGTIHYGALTMGLEPTSPKLTTWSSNL